MSPEELVLLLGLTTDASSLPMTPKKRPMQRTRRSRKTSSSEFSQQRRDRISDALKGRKCTWGDKLSAAQKGKPRPKLSPEAEAARREKIAAALRGKRRSPETIAKLKARPMTWGSKVSAALKSRSFPRGEHGQFASQKEEGEE